MMLEHQLDSVDELGGVDRLAERDALSPAALSVDALEAEQKDVAIGLAAEARPERGDEVHADSSQLETTGAH
jgi:hypothetical protein